MKNEPDYFLLVYDVATGDVSVVSYGKDRDRASDAYADREKMARDQEGIEVVLVGADSLETIHRTHSHYFVKRSDTVFEDLFSDLKELATT